MPLDPRPAAFRKLHQSGCFLLPNPWDVGSARLLAQLGFKALATTSSGFAWTTGRADNHVTLRDALAHFSVMAAAVDLPVNGDFEGGFAREPEGVAENVAAAVGTGIAGVSIEDSTGDSGSPLFAFDLALERVRAARHAIDASGTGVVFTARTEGFIVGRPDLDETIRRLVAFAEAGADCLFAPGIQGRDEIAAVVRAVAPKPVNVLVSKDFTTVARLADLGVRRISVGGGLARVGWAAVLGAAREMAEQGTFSALSGGMSGAELNRSFGNQ